MRPIERHRVRFAFSCGVLLGVWLACGAIWGLRALGLWWLA